jgi:hypothetical protein
MIRRSALALATLFAALFISGCGATKEDFLGPEQSWTNLTSEQHAIVSSLSLTTNSSHDPGIAALAAKGYSPIEIVQFGNSYQMAMVPCGNRDLDDCKNEVWPTNAQPFVVFDLGGVQADNRLNLAGTNSLLYPAGPKHNEHYSIRCNLVTMQAAPPASTSPAPSASSVQDSGLSITTVNEMGELGEQVASKVAPIKLNGDYPVTKLTLASGNVYGCVLDYVRVGALQ